MKVWMLYYADVEGISWCYLFDDLHQAIRIRQRFNRRLIREWRTPIFEGEDWGAYHADYGWWRVCEERVRGGRPARYRAARREADRKKQALRESIGLAPNQGSKPNTSQKPRGR